MSNKYSISEIIKIGYSLLLTKAFFKNARLVRRPVYVRGKKCLQFEKGLTTGYSCRFDLSGDEHTLIIGKCCEMGDNVHIVAHKKVSIGDNVLIASKVFISDTDHGVYSGEFQNSPDEKPNNRKLISKEVSIGDNVWIGENAVVLAGSTIGDGCIIGANSVVKDTFEANCIVAGTPAKVKKKYNKESKTWEIQ